MISCILFFKINFLSTECLHILGIGVLALADTTKIYPGCEYGMYLVAEAMELGRTIQGRVLFLKNRIGALSNHGYMDTPRVSTINFCSISF